ncbi:MAG: sporulation initiation factor Spo0A C-terminal domain-containing protein [Limnochordia bacterium]|nr:sporulation initiation factor Spo0A C-terminal domain-containing protein [Limnochordia bacterium]MDD2630458.1 sporulation initiation factor Spo0A C-terminal domain-containing protein [Limnochordia bacterium]
MGKVDVAIVGCNSFCEQYLPLLDKECIECAVYDSWQGVRHAPYPAEVIVSEPPAVKSDQFRRSWKKHWFRLPDRPRILLLIPEETPEVIELVQDNIVDYCLHEPISPVVLCNRILNLASFRHAHLAEQSLENRLHDCLSECGISPHLKGYGYLVAAITIGCNEPSALNNIGGMYESIAQGRDVKPSQVERAIRYAIESAYTKGSLTMLNQIAATGMDPEIGRPSNSSFISSLVSLLVRNY